jgi:hypothetical protein
VTGQRLLDLAAAPDASLAAVATREAEVAVTFGPDGHQSVFSRAWLQAHALDKPTPADPRTEDGKALWRAADLARVPGAGWAQYAADDAVRARVLDAVLTRGAAVLHGVPAAEGMVEAVAATLGSVRETNYGRLFDVRVDPSPANLAYTSREIGPHTDNPYRDPVPTVQLLHCLRDAAAGGDTLLVDGFAAAALLRVFSIFARELSALGFGAAPSVHFRRLRSAHDHLSRRRGHRAAVIRRGAGLPGGAGHGPGAPAAGRVAGRGRRGAPGAGRGGPAA